MTELPPTAAAALGQQAAGLIAKVAAKEPSIQNYMHSALDVLAGEECGMRRGEEGTGVGAKSAKWKNVKPKWGW